AHTVLAPGARAGPPGARDGAGEWGPGSPSIADLIVSERAPHVRNEGVEDPRLGDPAWARSEGLVAFAGYPLLVGAKRVGVVAVYSRRELPRDALELLEQVADSLALGIERLRAETELRMRVDFEQQLIGIVSHDLRNPLNAILLGATVLSQREVLDARATKSVLRIQSSAERASRMVKDLLDFTQARLGGGIRIDPRPTDIHEVARGVLEEVEAAHPTRELEVRHEGEGQGVWDADRLAQVVQNLVTNALKYSPEDSTVRILTRAEAEGVSLSVRNQGTPIPPNKLASIFEPLQRATAEVDKTGRSVGLGLYIVRSIVDAHGGTISVTSRETEGTVFTVRLPRHRVGA
ncbi:MAG: GAF domain-containing sensor histidine kinase, partial [Cystobacter sp.]